MSFIIYIKFKFGAHTARNTSNFSNYLQIEQYSLCTRTELPSEKGGRRLWIHKEQMRYESAHGCAHTRVQGCGESRDENAEPAPKGVHHKCDWQEGVLCSGAQRSRGERILTQDRGRRALGRATLCWLCGFSWSFLGWRFCSMSRTQPGTPVIAPSLWSGRKEEEGFERKKGSREGRKGGRQWVPEMLQDIWEDGSHRWEAASGAKRKGHFCQG